MLAEFVVTTSPEDRPGTVSVVEFMAPAPRMLDVPVIHFRASLLPVGTVVVEWSSYGPGSWEVVAASVAGRPDLIDENTSPEDPFTYRERCALYWKACRALLVEVKKRACSRADGGAFHA